MQLGTVLEKSAEVRCWAHARLSAWGGPTVKRDDPWGTSQGDSLLEKQPILSHLPQPHSGHDGACHLKVIISTIIKRQEWCNEMSADGSQVTDVF